MCEDFANKFAAFILENKFHDKGGRERQREIVSRYFALFTETYSFKIIEHLPRLSLFAKRTVTMCDRQVY